MQAENVSVIEATTSRKFLFFIKSFNSFLNSKAFSFFEAITEGGEGGASFAMKNSGNPNMVTRELHIIRYSVNLFLRQRESLIFQSSANIRPGIRLAIRFPIAIALLKVVDAITLSLSPNQALVRAAIVLKKNGYPHAITIYPISIKIKLELFKRARSLIHDPMIVQLEAIIS